jgi:hypothetical protein
MQERKSWTKQPLNWQACCHAFQPFDVFRDPIGPHRRGVCKGFTQGSAHFQATYPN